MRRDLTGDRPRVSLGLLLLIACAVEGAALVISVLAAGAGHGSYAPAKVLFPYTMALTEVTGSITSLLCGLALIQYPTYAVAVWVTGSASVGRWPWLVLARIHALAVSHAFASAAPTFTP